MAYTGVTLPLTGAGDATAVPAVDLINGQAYQAVKLMDGTEGSTVPVPAKGTTPGSTDHGLIVRAIQSTAFNQAVVGAVGLTSGSSAVELTSAGSTRLAGRVTVDNPTTSVNVANQPTVDLSSVGSTRSVGTVNQGSPAGSSADAWWVRTVTTGSAGGSTTVDANLTSAGSTKLVGMVELASGSTSRVVGAAVLASGSTSFLAGAVAVSSGVVLGAGSSANMLGQVAQGAGSTSIAPWYVISSGGGGSTVVDVNNPTTAVDVANIPTVLPGSGSSSVAPWGVDGLRFSSGQTSATTLATSAESQLLAANAARRGAVITNLSSAVELLIGFTTATVSTAKANCHYVIPANSKLTIGGQLGDVPLYLGPIRGRLNSTTLTGIAGILQFTT